MSISPNEVLIHAEHLMQKRHGEPIRSRQIKCVIEAIVCTVNKEFARVSAKNYIEKVTQKTHVKPKQSKQSVDAFSCAGCSNLQAKYVGDGFDEFYEWKCRAKKLRLIGHDEPFHDCKLPLWCPKIASLKKLIKENGKKG